MSKQFGRISGFWVGLSIILTSAAIMYLLSYQFSLPYIDHPDEPRRYWEAQIARGNTGIFDDPGGYPPGYTVVNIVAQWVVEFFGHGGLSETVRALRLVAVGVSLLTIIMISLTARLAAGGFSGVIAGAVWAVSPIMVAHSVYATADPFAYLWAIMSVWLAAIALVDQKKRVVCLWSTVVGLLAVTFKYTLIPVLIPGVVVTLVVFWRDRRLGLRYGLIQGLMVFCVGVLIVIVCRVGRFPINEVGLNNWEQTIHNVLLLSRTVHNIFQSIVPVLWQPWAIITALGLAAYGAARRYGLNHIRLSVMGLCLTQLIFIPWVVASYDLTTVANRIRDVLPATTMVCVIFGSMAAQVVMVFPRRYLRVATALVSLALVVLVFIPQLEDSWRLVQERQMPDHRVALRQYVDINLEPGTIIVDGENHKTFNPYWGGLEARHWVDWWISDNIMEYSVEEWRGARQMTYAAIPLVQWQEMQATQAGRDYLAQMLHLRDFTDPPDQRGPEVILYRFWRMEHETDIQFGDAIHLVGYDQNREQAAPGDELALRFYWQATARPATDYSLFIHFVPVDGYEALTQADGAPAVLERPAPTWDTPNETLISPEFRLTVPSDIPPGDYRVMIGLYNYVTGERLPVTDVESGESLGDAFELARISVTAG